MSATNGAFFTEQFLKPNGEPAAGVRVFHYVAGNTTTNLDVYQNANLTAPHSNPVIGDSIGRVSFYGNGTYRLLVKTAQDDPEYPNTTLYDWDNVELVHHTATLRAEDRGLSLPSASAAARGRLFGVTNAGGDVLSIWVQRTAAAWLQLLTLPTLAQMLEFNKGTTIASSTSLTIPSDGNFFDVTGTNTIETMSGFTGYPIVYLRTLSALTFKNHATNLIMLGASDRVTLANQVTAFLHLGAGQWMELYYTNPFWGDGNLVDGSVLVGNAQGAITEIALPTAGRVLCHSGVAASDPSWLTGLRYHGPTAVGAGSALSHEGNVTITSNQGLNGVHFYSNFTLNAGVTVTLGAGVRRLVIMASDTITINGSINATSAGASGGGGSASGGHGTDQPGGAGSGDAPGSGGSALINGIAFATPATTHSLSPWLAMGGAGGGGGFFTGTGETAVGGAGGGSIVLIAPAVTLGGGCVLNTSGAPGASTGGGFGAGGGGAGNIYITTRLYTNNGATFSQTGGAGGFGSSASGSTGGNGVRQINIYG